VPLDASDAAGKTKFAAATAPAIVNATDADCTAFEASRGGPIATELSSGHDWILFYAADRAALEASLHAVSTALATPGTLWIAYPKGSSKTQDLTRDRDWDAVRDEDLMWLTLISIDDRWSAFSLRHYKPDEARQTFR
jgi:hypothetical protein